MEIRIRNAEENDMDQIHNMVCELAEYEKGLSRVITSPESYRRDFRQGVFKAIVAERKNAIIGIALYYTAFSTWRGKMLYLEDFVVREHERRNGIGAMLFDQFLVEAKSEGAVMIKWQVLRWNEPAINFYKKYDTVLDDEWVDGKIHFI